MALQSPVGESFAGSAISHKVAATGGPAHARRARRRRPNPSHWKMSGSDVSLAAPAHFALTKIQAPRLRADLIERPGLDAALGAALVALFALLHGHAHGAELPSGAAALTYAAGFALATALLHAIGLGIAYLGRSNGGKLVVRGAGAAVAAAGVALAVV